MVAIKFKETLYRKPDGSIVLHVIPKVGGDAPAIDFYYDEVTAALRSERAQVNALEEHKRQINGERHK